VAEYRRAHTPGTRAKQQHWIIPSSTSKPSTVVHHPLPSAPGDLHSHAAGQRRRTSIIDGLLLQGS
jgi:hypothetical protein